MHLSAKKIPRRNDDRVILHFDYDCFYAQVVENQQPALRSLPLGIKQKSILATCNYVARRRGVKKLMVILEARNICPDLVLVEGEDLTPFRDVSKRLYALLRAYSWSRKVERLGLDEVFFDATDLVAWNAELLNRNTLARSFFCLSRDDPEKGFVYDATAFAGFVHGLGNPGTSGLENPGTSGLENPLYVRLLLASHLARYLRLQIEEQGFTSACGIATNKTLAKLAGSRNKPRNQTTLLSLHDAAVMSFMDEYTLRQVPGFGPRITRILEDLVTGRPTAEENITDCPVTVRQLRNHPDASAALMEKLLGGHGLERGIGAKLFRLLHGVDDAEVRAASDVPTQISIEDTYQGLNTPDEINRELRLLTASLLRRMHADLLDDGGGEAVSPPRWIAQPRTLRLTTRPKTTPAEGRPYNWARASRSQPLPAYVFSHAVPVAQTVERLVVEAVLPMFAKLNPAAGGWRIGMLNIGVAGMVLAGSESGLADGRDIAAMFRRQEDVLREFTTYDDDARRLPGVQVGHHGRHDEYEHEHLATGVHVAAHRDETESENESDGGLWGDDDRERAELCMALEP
ncbi:hypothetical protein P8C59_000262 [Phyllachora maydis]|uniref:UmuC domain-containing protein n=1 Tax=Phyllachora maydis TaxID=1825666 RepID=A0AAD9HVJ5_9PEZI|nr:hypothetical protein P8C59_000262 [Phyllachora maydis]